MTTARGTTASKERSPSGATHPDAATPYAILANMPIARLRARSQRNILATMFVSSGTPMLTGGDEFGRTQTVTTTPTAKTARSRGSTGIWPKDNKRRSTPSPG